jgi:hypothetical protein
LFPNSIEISLREAKFKTSNTQLHDNLLSSAMFQLYHGENKLDDNFRFVANTNVIVFGLTQSGLEPPRSTERGYTWGTIERKANNREEWRKLVLAICAMRHNKD